MALTRSAGDASSGGRARQTSNSRRNTRYSSRHALTAHDSYHSKTASTGVSDESEADIIAISSDSDSELSDAFSLTTRPNRRAPVLQPKNRPPRRNSNTSSRKQSKPPMRRRAAVVPHGNSGSKAKKGAKSSPSKTSSVSPAKQRQNQKQKQVSTSQSATTTAIPNWLDPRISYDCWVAIFLQAASECSNDSYTSWLLDVALVCRAFTEPALKAIYWCPVIRTPTKARRLASLLERNPHDTYSNYRTKIEYLHIDIQIVPQPLLYPLIHPLPRLKELIIYTTTDQLPYRKLEPNGRWHYPESVFKALLANSDSQDAFVDKPWPTVLKNWEWSGRLIGGHVATVDDVARIHQLPSFAHLTRISFTNFQVPSLRYLAAVTTTEAHSREDDLFVESVACAISQLKSLKHLVFESSTVMNDRLLSLLSQDLHHLDLINCWEITSQNLESYLQDRGSELLSLTLLHNQSLNLEFLTGLAASCPRLRYLHINMSYFRHHGSVNDSNPMYDFALLPSQRPNWPSTLRVLNIEHIRNWHEDTAEMFLQSIADSSAELTDLRHLCIKTMLDIPWQARAELRKKWRPEMDRIFLRPIIPPKERKTLRQCAATAEVGRASQKRKRRGGNSTNPPSRRSGRIADSRSERDQRLRRARYGRLMYREPDTDEHEFDVSSEDEGSSSEETSPDNHKRSKDSESTADITQPVVQGLCDTVNILFDNQKPTELQFGMDDFLGEEESEEEWDGADDEEDLSIAF